jgi:hypothetical protein
MDPMMILDRQGEQTNAGMNAFVYRTPTSASWSMSGVGIIVVPSAPIRGAVFSRTIQKMFGYKSATMVGSGTHD